MLQIQDGHLRPSPREPLLGNTLPALLRCAASGRWRLPTDLGCVCKRVKKRRTENVVPLRLIREKKKLEASVGFTAHRRSLPAPIRRLDPDVLAVLHHQIINSLFSSLSPFELNQSIWFDSGWLKTAEARFLCALCRLWFSCRPTPFSRHSPAANLLYFPLIRVSAHIFPPCTPETPHSSAYVIHEVSRDAAPVETYFTTSGSLKSLR